MSSTYHPRGTGQRITEQLGAQFVREYQAGAGLIEIAREHGTSVPTVRKYLLRAGVTMRPIGQASPLQLERRALEVEVRREAIAEDFRAGMTVAELATRYELSRDTVCSILDRCGFGAVERRMRRRRFTPQEVAQLIREYDAGASTVELGRRYDCDNQTIRRTILRAGGRTRPRGTQRWASA